MIEYIYIAAGYLYRWTLAETDHVLLTNEESLIISKPDWDAMCKEAGSEEALMKEMEVVEWTDDQLA